MSTGPLNPAKDNDMLFIGSKTNLLVYGKFMINFKYTDVENNCDIFDKEVADGVNCLTFGTFP